MPIFGFGLWGMMCLSAAGAPLAAEPRPSIGHMAPSDVPDMPLSDVVREYGDWVIQKSSALVSAMTYSAGGGMFGLFCGKTCSYYTNPNVNCRAGEVSAGLITSSAGTMAVSLRCFHVKEEGEEEVCMLIEEDLSDLLADTERFSLTIPLAEGPPHVDIYSMKGAQAAQSEMLDMATEMAGGTASII
jgi:hypothetical protein